MIRKVQSMECVRISSVEIKGEWVYNGSKNQEKKASRFSRTAYRTRSLKLAMTPEKSSLENSGDCNISSCVTLLDAATSDKVSNITTRSSLNTSITGLNVVERDQNMIIFNGERYVPYGTLFIILFFFASVSSYNSDSQSKNFLFQSSHKNPTDGVSTNKNNNNRLGSAMIQSVTEALSPILPFTGGIDLRRDGNWKSWRNWFGLLITLKSPVDLTNSSTASQKISLFPRGGKRDNTQDMASARKNRIKPTYSISLSTNEPFISTDKIAQMTLNEIALVFRYAIEAGRNSFNSNRFFSQNHINQRVIDTMKSIDRAVSQSRGPHILPADTSQIHLDFTTTDNNYDTPLSPQIGYGDVDALQFCAAMRLFAEWRLLRQVPSGYKAYAVGMNLGHKDIVQNVAKIENAVHEWIRSAEVEASKEVSPSEVGKGTYPIGQNSGDECVGHTSSNSVHFVRRSPTLRQLLLHEINMDTHTRTKLPRLKDNTAAMGLLWVRRQLHYQTVIFRNVISVPQVYPSVIKAVGAAYSEVYDGVHGWAVQKIFNYSFQAAPDAEEIFRHMNPDELAKVRIAVAEESVDDNSATLDDISLKHSLEPVNDESVGGQAYLETNLPRQGKQNNFMSANKENPLAKLGSHIACEWDKLGQNIVSEWDKLGQNIGGEFDKVTCGIGKILKHEDSKDCDQKQVVKVSSGNRKVTSKSRPALSGELLEKYINEQMSADARLHITTYLHVATPLLVDLAGLFAEMNMDDPTKV